MCIKTFAEKKSRWWWLQVFLTVANSEEKRSNWHQSSFLHNMIQEWIILYFPAAIGFLNTKITESPRRNILAMYLSLLTGFAFFPFPDLGVSVHISFTFSKTMLQCLSKAFTLASSFLLFRQLISTWVLFFTDCVKTERGPVLNSSCSLWASSSGVISLLGLFILGRRKTANLESEIE